jgi:hypothetical protein
MFSPGRNLFDTKEKYFFHEKSSNFIQILTKFNVDNWRVRLFLFCIFQVKIFCSKTYFKLRFRIPEAWSSHVFIYSPIINSIKGASRYFVQKHLGTFLFKQEKNIRPLPLKVFFLLNGLNACYLSKNYVNSIFLREIRVIKLYTYELWTFV